MKKFSSLKKYKITQTVTLENNLITRDIFFENLEFAVGTYDYLKQLGKTKEISLWEKGWFWGWWRVE